MVGRTLRKKGKYEKQRNLFFFSFIFSGSKQFEFCLTFPEVRTRGFSGLILFAPKINCCTKKKPNYFE